MTRWGRRTRLVASELTGDGRISWRGQTHLGQAYAQAQQEANDNFPVISIAPSRGSLLPFSWHTKTSRL